MNAPRPRGEEVEVALTIGDRVRIREGCLAGSEGVVWHIGPADLYGWFGSPIYLDLDDGTNEGPFQRTELSRLP